MVLDCLMKKIYDGLLLPDKYTKCRLANCSAYELFKPIPTRRPNDSRKKAVLIADHPQISFNIFSGTSDDIVEKLDKGLLGVSEVGSEKLDKPHNDVYDAWKAMEELQKAGKIRAIGISNFSVDRAIDLAVFNEVTPQVNKIEINPFNQQVKNTEALSEEGIMSEAWRHLLKGKTTFFKMKFSKKLEKNTINQLHKSLFVGL